MTYYAVWTANSYTATFDSNGGLPVADQTAQGTFGGNYDFSAIVEPSRDGYTFAGWGTTSTTAVADAEDIGELSTIVTVGGVTYYAVWTAIEYDITYELNDGAVDATTPNPLTYDITNSFTLNNPTRDGYTFDGWTVELVDAITVPGDTTNITLGTTTTVGTGTYGNLKFTANWLKNIPNEQELEAYVYSEIHTYTDREYTVTAAEIETFLTNKGLLPTGASVERATVGRTDYGTTSFEYTVTGLVGYTQNSFVVTDNTLTVNKATLTVTPTHADVTYGDPVPTDGYGYTLSGFVGTVDNANNIGLTGTIAQDQYSTTYQQDNLPNAAGYTITLQSTGNLSSTNYNFALATGSHNVDKASINDETDLANNDVDVTYDSNSHAPTVVLSNVVPNTGFTLDYGTGTVSATSLADGTATFTLPSTIDATLDADLNLDPIVYGYTITSNGYEDISSSVSTSIARRNVTLTANDVTAEYLEQGITNAGVAESGAHNIIEADRNGLAIGVTNLQDPDALANILPITPSNGAYDFANTTADVFGVSFTANNNYNITLVNGSLTVVANEFVGTDGETLITEVDVDTIYNAQPHAPAVTASTTNGQTATIMYGNAVGNYTETLTAAGFPTRTDATENNGETITYFYEVTAQGYVPAQGSVTVDIARRDVTLTANSAQREYLEALGTAESYTETAGNIIATDVQGLNINVNHDAANVATLLNTVPTGDGTGTGYTYADTTADVFTITHTANNNYDFTLVNGSLTVVANEFVDEDESLINATNVNETYDATPYAPSVTASTTNGQTATIMYGNAVGNYTETLTAAGFPTRTDATENNGGTITYFYEVTAQGYVPTQGSVTVDIAQLDLPLTANSSRVEYQAGVAQTVSGVEETGTSIVDHRVVSTSSVTETFPGTYPHVATLADVTITDATGTPVTNNYDITLTDGSLEIYLPEVIEIPSEYSADFNKIYDDVALSVTADQIARAVEDLLSLPVNYLVADNGLSTTGGDVADSATGLQVMVRLASDENNMTEASVDLTIAQRPVDYTLAGLITPFQTLTTDAQKAALYTDAALEATGVLPQDIASFGFGISIADEATLVETVDTHEDVISLTFTANPNYVFTVNTSDLTVDNSIGGIATIDAAGAPVAKVYDATPITASPAMFAVTNQDGDDISGDVTLVEYSTDGGTTFTTTAPSITGVAAVPFTARFTVYGYDPIIAQATLAVTPAPVTFTVADATKVAGDADPAFVAGVTAGTVYGAQDIVYAITREAGDVAGETYELTGSQVGTNPNYTVTFVPGTLTVTAPAVEVIPDEPTPLDETPDDEEPTTTDIEDEDAPLDDGEGTTEIEDEEAPLASGRAWSLFDLIMTGVAIVLALGYLVVRPRKEEYQTQEEEESKNKKRLFTSLGLAIMAVFSVVLLLLTQDFTQPMIVFDIYSVVFAVVALVQAGVMFFVRKKDDEDNKTAQF